MVYKRNEHGVFQLHDEPVPAKKSDSDSKGKAKAAAVNPRKEFKSGSWNVVYENRVLRSFEKELLADLFLEDSAHQDVAERGWMILNRRTTDRPIRHLETGKIYPSIVACAKDIGLSYNTVKNAIYRGSKCFGNHFEYLKGFA